MPKEYNVWFSFYDQQQGCFNDTVFRVDAENQFEARYKAWLLCEENEDYPFMANLKQFAVTWTANPLDLQDYFNSCAADMKMNIGRIENVTIPDLKIRGEDFRISEKEQEKALYVGGLMVIDDMAKDFGQGYHLPPPSIFEEIYFAKKLCDYLDSEGKYDQSQELWNKADKAEKGDGYEKFEIKDIFKKGYAVLCGDVESFKNEYLKNGTYPLNAKPDDEAYIYINRAKQIFKRDNLANLPIYGEKDVIPKSNMLNYEYRILVLNKDVLKEEYQKPENMLWLANGGGFGCDPDARGRSVYCENIITGKKYEWKRPDFVGVLRPEIEAKIDFEALKAEYCKLHGIDEPEEIADTEESEDTEDFEDGMEV